MVRIEDQSGIALLGKVNSQGQVEIIAQSEDIVPEIAKLVPAREALELATQLAKGEIEKMGGVEKAQASIDANARKYGIDFYNYLTPLSVAAFKANGVIIPNRK